VSVSSDGGGEETGDPPRPDRDGLLGRFDRWRAWSYARLGPRTTRWVALLAAALLVLGGLSLLRLAAPDSPPSRDATRDGQKPEPSRRRPLPATVSPTAPPRGPLPKPDVVDRAANRIAGDLPAPKASEQTALFGVGTILEWYCPSAGFPRVEMHRRGEADSYEANVEPHPGYAFQLRLSWNGESYQWEGPYDALDLCW
jgi:hypothetical protein